MLAAAVIVIIVTPFDDENDAVKAGIVLVAVIGLLLVPDLMSYFKSKKNGDD